MSPRKFYYHYSYDEKTDEFFAFVDKTADHSDPGMVFRIDNTQEMLDIIKTGRMKHIDDMIGLAAFLVAQEIILPGDVIELIEEMLH